MALVQKKMEEKAPYIVSFTGGGKKQLEDLKEYFHVADSLEVVKMGIAMLEKVKEQTKIQHEYR
jgi:hypothetical protein